MSDFPNPEVGLPFVDGIPAYLNLMVEMPAKVTADLGPQVAAQSCDQAATGLLKAFDMGLVLYCGDQVVNPEDVEVLANYLSTCARRLEFAVN